MNVINKPLEFDWDTGNIGKNLKHKVKDKEVEETFFDRYRVIYKDVLHSRKEDRYILIGKTKKKKTSLYGVYHEG